MKVVVFGATNSKQSINQKLAIYASSLVSAADEIKILNLNDYEMPIFSLEREKEVGQHQLAKDFYKEIGDADLLVISFAEFNGSYTPAYKNTFDWTSRIDTKVFQNTKAIFLSTSPGPGGAKNVLKSAVDSAGFFGAEMVGHMSLPSFFENFSEKDGVISNPELDAELRGLISQI